MIACSSTTLEYIYPQILSYVWRKWDNEDCDLKRSLFPDVFWIATYNFKILISLENSVLERSNLKWFVYFVNYILKVNSGLISKKHVYLISLLARFICCLLEVTDYKSLFFSLPTKETLTYRVSKTNNNYILVST